MASINSFMNVLFGALWVPFSGIHPWVGLAVLSVLVGILALIGMKYLSNQGRIAELKDRYKAHVLAIRLFRDDLVVVARSMGRTLLLISFYMGHQLRPMVVILIPFVLIFAQMQMRLAYDPVPLGQKVYVKVALQELRPGVDAEVELALPEGVEIAGAVVNAAEKRLKVFPLRATRGGSHELHFSCGDETVTKTFHAGDVESLEMLSPRRASGFLDLLLYPTEPGFGEASRFASIDVPYDIKPLPLLGIDWSFGFELGMGLTFMILSILAAFALKGAFGVTI